MVFLMPDKMYTANGLTVKQYFITAHNPNKISLPAVRTKPLIGITVHNTDDINEARQTTDPEQYVRATVNGNMSTVRVHFYVDDDECWQMLPLTQQSWHAGQAGKADRNGSEAGNAQTISIECIMDGSGSEKDKRAEDNCARLVAYLLKKYSMTIENNLFTHNYWCNIRNGRTGSIDVLNKMNDGYKSCPKFIRPHWDEFKAKVRSYMPPPVDDSKYLYRVVCGSFANKANAEKLLNEVKSAYPDAFISAVVKK